MKQSIEQKRARQMERYNRDKEAINARRRAAYKRDRGKADKAKYQANREYILSRQNAYNAKKREESNTLKLAAREAA